MNGSYQAKVFKVELSENDFLGLQRLLRAIVQNRPDYIVWGVANLDVLGEQAQDFCDILEKSHDKRALIPSGELLSKLIYFEQVIEGTFVAYAGSEDAQEFLNDSCDLREFPGLNAQFAVVVIDGWCLDVYVKHKADLDTLLGCFNLVERQNERKFFF